MSFSEFAGVVRLVDHYLAIHVEGREKACISKHPEVDIKVAALSAKTFATAKGIRYEEDLFELDRPIITILKDVDSKWYPLELHPDKMILVTKFGPLVLGGTKEEATHMAKLIALAKKTDCVPSIGESLEKG